MVIVVGSTSSNGEEGDGSKHNTTTSLEENAFVVVGRLEDADVSRLLPDP